MKKKAFGMGIAAAMFALTLAGCGSNNNNAESGSSPSASAPASSEASASETASTYPIVIKHAFGETIIEKRPERVATIQWANHDVALALGVVPVGFSASNYGVSDDSGMNPWTAAKVKELGVDKPNIYQDTDGLDFEAISDSDPDVILAAYSGITKEDYETLSAIAPVVAYPTNPWLTTWREQITLNAEGMGMKAEGEKLLQDSENIIKEKLSAYPQIAGKKVVLASLSVADLSKFWIYTPGDPRAAFLLDLGLSYPDSVLSLAKPGEFAVEISSENADKLNDADIIITYGNEDLVKAMQADPLLSKIPAVKNGAVVTVGDSTPLAASINPNPLSILFTMDEYLKLIGAAADKVQ